MPVKINFLPCQTTLDQLYADNRPIPLGYTRSTTNTRVQFTEFGMPMFMNACTNAKKV